MEDLIKRSDAIKAIEPYLDYIEIIPLCGAKPYVREAVYGIRSKIKFIPTIESRRGEWIEHEWAEEAEGLLVSNYECSECHNWERKTSDYCPNCGSKMRGERND